ncbi:MAG: hypothetical protein ACP5KW_04055 [Thermoproteota archaeon]
MLKQKYFVTLLLFVILLFSLTGQVNSQQSASKATVVYLFKIFDTGNVNSTFIIEDPSYGRNSLWVLVPKNDTYQVFKLKEGQIVNKTISQAFTSSGAPYAFYDNLSLVYEGPLYLEITWNLSYGALIVEPNALFFSPAIGFSRNLKATAIVDLPNITKGVKEYYPIPVKRNGNEFYFEPSSDERIGIAFTVGGNPDQINISSGSFVFKVPRRYKNIAERILNFYVNLSSKFNKIFNKNLSSVEVNFFVPNSLNDISLGGFVPIESAVKLGNINLNIFYIRTKSGYFEAIAAHELIHYYAFEAGISPKVLWFHEGLANYIGISVAKQLGSGAYSIEEDLINTASELNDNLIFVFNWTPDHIQQNRTLFEYYAASYCLVKSLLNNFSSPSDNLFKGENFLSKFFHLITKSNVSISSNDQLLRYLYAASNYSNTFIVFFLKYGFVYNISDYFAFTKLNLPSFFAPLLKKLENSSSSSYYLIENIDPLEAEQFIKEVSALINNFEKFPLILSFFTFSILVTAIAEINEEKEH